MRDYYIIMATACVTMAITLYAVVPSSKTAWDKIGSRIKVSESSVVYTTIDSAITRDEIVALGTIASKQSKDKFYYIQSGN